MSSAHNGARAQPTAGRWRSVAATSLLLAGCYASHGLDGAPGSDAPAADAHADAPDGHVDRRDAGTPPLVRDAGPGDAGLLPLGEDPVFEPGERPSDRPEAEEWVDREPIPGVDPCCDMDPPLALFPGRFYFQDPLVEWADGSWGVFVTATALNPDMDPREPHVWGLYYARVDAEVRHVELERTLVRRGPFGLMLLDVERAAGRFGMLMGGWFPEPPDSGVGFAIFDRDAVQDGPWRLPEHRNFVGGSLTRQALHGVWAVTGDPEPTSTEGQFVRAFQGTREVASHRLGAGVRDARDVRLEGLGSRTMVVWATPEERLMVRSLEVAGAGFLDEALDVGTAQIRFQFDDHGYSSDLMTAPFRNSVLITHNAGGQHAWLTMVDPFERTSRTVEIGPTEAQRVGVVGSDKDGLIGVCYPTGAYRSGVEGVDSGPQGLEFRMFAADGTPLGEPVTVTSERWVVMGCHVAYHLGAFVVLWVDVPEVGDSTLVARRLVPRLEP